MVKSKVLIMDNPFQQLHDRLTEIEKMVSELRSERYSAISAPEDDLLTINEASELLHLAKPTIYFLTSNSKIPVFKKGKRLFFSKIELLNWLKSGRRLTLDQINRNGDEYISKRKAFRV